jgi:hypothetical protein
MSQSLPLLRGGFGFVAFHERLPVPVRLDEQDLEMNRLLGIPLVDGS